MINFSNQDVDDDDITPFFGNTRQCNSIFDSLNDGSSQDKSVYNMFNQSNCATNNHISENPVYQESSQFEQNSMNSLNKMSKNSKKSIIDDLGDYDFRKRVDTLEESICDSNSSEIFKQQRKSSDRNVNKLDNRLEQSIVEQFKKDKLQSQIQVSKKENVRKQKNRQCGQMFKFKPINFSRVKNNGSKTDKNKKEISFNSVTQDTMNPNNLRQNSNNLRQNSNDQTQNSKSNNEQQMQATIKIQQQCKDRNKQQNRDEQIQKNREQRLKYRKQPQIIENMNDIEHKQSKKQQINVKTNRKSLEFSLNLGLRKSKAIQQILSQKQYHINKVQTNRIQTNKVQTNRIQTNKVQTNRIQKQHKLNFNLKQQLANRQKRFTQKFRFKPTVKQSKNQINRQSRNRTTLKPSLHLKNKQKQSITKDHHNCKVDKKQTNFSNKFMMTKLNTHQKQCNLSTKQQVCVEPQHRKSNLKCTLSQYNQQIDQIYSSIIQTRYNIQQTKNYHHQISKKLQQCNYYLDKSQIHSLSQSMTNQSNQNHQNQIHSQSQLPKCSENSKETKYNKSNRFIS